MKLIFTSDEQLVFICRNKILKKISCKAVGYKTTIYLSYTDQYLYIAIGFILKGVIFNKYNRLFIHNLNIPDRKRNMITEVTGIIIDYESKRKIVNAITFL